MSPLSRLKELRWLELGDKSLAMVLLSINTSNLERFESEDRSITGVPLRSSIRRFFRIANGKLFAGSV